jgi:hypothetical protein
MGGFKVFFKGTIAIILMGIVLGACFTAPEFPNEPSISFNNIVFKKGADQFDQDSLILSINFQDGDGDLGLRNEGADTREPYHALWAFTKPDGTLLQLKDRDNPDYDTLPPYAFPYYCINYTINEEDTIYVEPNKFHYNIYVKYFVRKNGVYTEFDWLTAFDPICGETFNGRFPLLNNPNKERPLEGKLSYKMKSAGFELLFRQDTLMIETYIIDRALNISNTISTPDFVLKDITVGG